MTIDIIGLFICLRYEHIYIELHFAKENLSFKDKFKIIIQGEIMRKILLASLLLSTPAMSYDIDTYIERSLKSFENVMWEYSSGASNNGKYDTRNTTDTTASTKLTDIFGGAVSVGLTSRDEDRKKVLEFGTLAGHERSYILSFNFTRIEPSWGFWGLTGGYGTAKNDITLDWSTDANTKSVIDSVTSTTGKGSGDGQSLFQRYMIAAGIDKSDGSTTKMTELTTSLIDTSTTEQDVANMYSAVETAYILQGGNVDGSPKTSTRLGKKQYGSTTSDLSLLTLYAGTKIKFKYMDIVPTIKYTVHMRTLEQTSLTAADSDSTEFAQTNGKDTQLALGLKVSRQIGKGLASFSTAIVDTTGTNIMYNIIGGGATAISDNPTNRIAVTHRIGYSLPVRDDFAFNVAYDYYKNGSDIATTAYVGFIYEF